MKIDQAYIDKKEIRGGNRIEIIPTHGEPILAIYNSLEDGFLNYSQYVLVKGTDTFSLATSEIDDIYKLKRVEDEPDLNEATE